MSIGRTNATPGSGNFGLQIVGGTTRPKNPTHGMVWANTPNEITDIYLSAEKPTNPVAGALWVRISNFGGKKIVSPVSKESITVYPLSAEQYINAAWVEIEVMSYQDVKWVAWIPEGALYYRGDEMIAKTGGWEATTWLPTGSYTNVGFTFEKNEDQMSLGYSISATAGRDWCITSSDKIDMSKYNTLGIVAEHSWEACKVGLSSAKPSSSATVNWIASIDIPKSHGTTTLDISDCDSSYYVVVWLYSPKTLAASNVDVYEIVAE